MRKAIGNKRKASGLKVSRRRTKARMMAMSHLLVFLDEKLPK